MSLRQLTGTAAIVLCSLVTAASAQQLSEPRLLKTTERSASAARRAPTSAARSKSTSRSSRAAYDQPTPAPRYSSAPSAQRRLSQLPRSKTPTDAPRDLFEDTEPPADAPAETEAEPAMEQEAPADEPTVEMDTPDAAPPEKPSDDMFESPATEQPAEESPLETMPPQPRRAPSAEPPRRETPPAPAPNRSAPSRTPPSRSAPPAPRTLPPRMERGEEVPPSRDAQPPQPVPEHGTYEEGVFTEYGDSMDCEQCGYECQTCEQAVGGYGYWDNFCPPPIDPRIFKGTWVSVDYLMWWSRGASLPPLVTTGSDRGALNDPNLGILFGDSRVDNTIRSGGRLNVGTWLNCDQTFGIGASFVDLQNMATNYAVDSNGSTILARPFLNASTATDDSILIASPGLFSGAITARTTNSFIGFDTFVRRALAFAPGRRLDVLWGYRYLQLSDSLDIADHSVSIDPNSGVFPLGTIFNGRDQFRAANRFNGFEMGLMSERRRGIWSISTTGKVALGNMHQTVIINGDHAVIEPGGPTSTGAGDVLAQPSNIGRYDRNVFSAIPETSINLGCQITPRLRANFGYSLIYIGRVAQAARQIDPTIDPTQFDTGTGKFPAFSWQQNSFWLQGMNFGLSYRY